MKKVVLLSLLLIFFGLNAAEPESIKLFQVEEGRGDNQFVYEPFVAGGGGFPSAFCVNGITEDFYVIDNRLTLDIASQLKQFSSDGNLLNDRKISGFDYMFAQNMTYYAGHVIAFFQNDTHLNIIEFSNDQIIELQVLDSIYLFFFIYKDNLFVSYKYKDDFIKHLINYDFKKSKNIIFSENYTKSIQKKSSGFYFDDIFFPISIESFVVNYEERFGEKKEYLPTSQTGKFYKSRRPFFDKNGNAYFKMIYQNRKKYICIYDQNINILAALSVLNDLREKGIEHYNYYVTEFGNIYYFYYLNDAFHFYKIPRTWGDPDLYALAVNNFEGETYPEWAKETLSGLSNRQMKEELDIFLAINGYKFPNSGVAEMFKDAYWYESKYDKNGLIKTLDENKKEYLNYLIELCQKRNVEYAF